MCQPNWRSGKLKNPSIPEQKSLTHCAKNFLSSSYCFEIQKQ